MCTTFRLLFVLLVVYASSTPLTINEVPNIVIQFGHPRTATTLQFQTLCLMMVTVLSRLKKLDELQCQFFKQLPKPKSQKNHYSVLKTHALPSNLSYPHWLFTTYDPHSNSSDPTAELISRKANVKFKASIAQVERQGNSIAWEYQEMFGLSNAEMNNIIDYLRYWDILRLCCGLQMSSDWRNYLIEYYDNISGYENFINTAGHHKFTSPSYPACEIYDIDKVSYRLLNNPLAKLMLTYPNLKRMVQPSEVDGSLTETYCSMMNERIHTLHLGFNKDGTHNHKPNSLSKGEKSSGTSS